MVPKKFPPLERATKEERMAKARKAARAEEERTRARCERIEARRHAYVQRTNAQSRAAAGHRQERKRALTHDDLWLNELRPSVDVSPAPEHKCGICFGIKSHPVV